MTPTAKNIKPAPVKEEIKSACEEKGLNCKTLQIEETVYNTLYTKKFETRKPYKPADPKMIISFIPGTILKILVSKGDKLKAGDPILILEAMKMRNIVTAPMSGKLKKINVKEGDTIPKSFIIAEFQ
jgi:biotin carboxyl carrier protein